MKWDAAQYKRVAWTRIEQSDLLCRSNFRMQETGLKWCSDRVSENRRYNFNPWPPPTDGVNPSNRFSFRHLSSGTFFEGPSPRPWGPDDRAVKRRRALRTGVQASLCRSGSVAEPFDVTYSRCRISDRPSIVDFSGLNSPGSWWRSRSCRGPWTLLLLQQPTTVDS